MGVHVSTSTLQATGEAPCGNAGHGAVAAVGVLRGAGPYVRRRVLSPVDPPLCPAVFGTGANDRLRQERRVWTERQTWPWANPRDLRPSGWGGRGSAPGLWGWGVPGGDREG